MRSTFYKPWMCVQCGYMMDAASHMKKDVTPDEGDLSICLNCGKTYKLKDRKWIEATSDEMNTLSRDLKLEIFEIQIARRAVVNTDLSKRNGRA